MTFPPGSLFVDDFHMDEFSLDEVSEIQQQFHPSHVDQHTPLRSFRRNNNLWEGRNV